MAKEETQADQKTIVIPLRRLLTGVPRTKRAPSSIPRIKRYVLRHIKPEWRDAIWDEQHSVHRIWIDDFLNQTIWSRGRGHVGGPAEWIPAKKEGQRNRLAKRTTSRYGSILKVKVLYLEEPGEGEDPRVDVYLYGYEDKKSEEEDDKHKGHDHDDDDEGGEETAHDEADDEEDDDDDVDEPAAKPAAKSDAEAKRPASTSAAAKGAKPAAAKADAKKAPAKPKKEGGD
jgi:ribosomal protein L31E